MLKPFWQQNVSWSKELELHYQYPQRIVTPKGIRRGLRKLAAPKLIKHQLQEIAADQTTSSSSPASGENDEHDPAATVHTALEAPVRYHIPT